MPVAFSQRTVQPPATKFPVSVSGRNLNDVTGQPFFIQGMALWEMEVNPTRVQVGKTLDGLASQGFNAVLVEFAEHLFSYQTPPPQNVEGNLPFVGMTGTTPPYGSVDFSAVNPLYMSFLQFVQQETEKRNMLFLITPAYYGFASTQEGWGVGGELLAQSNAQLQAFGAALGNAFKTAKNMMVIWGGDNASGAAQYAQILIGMQSIGVPNWQYSGHSSRGNDAFSAFGASPGITINTQYSNNAGMVGDAATAYARGLPFFLIEDEYENASAQTNQTQRCQKYQSALSGACGFFFGGDPMWSHGCDTDSGRQTADVAACLAAFLFTTASKSMTYVSQIVKSVPRVEPQTGTTLVTTTLGTGAAAICAALSAAGTAALIYTPVGAGFTVNLAAFTKSSLVAQWFDPTNGAFQTASGSPFANTGTNAFTTPGANAGGDSDWVLRLS